MAAIGDDGYVSRKELILPAVSWLMLVPTTSLCIRSVALDVVEQFATYEDYLDAQVTETDMYFLEVRPTTQMPMCMLDRSACNITFENGSNVGGVLPFQLPSSLHYNL